MPYHGCKYITFQPWRGAAARWTRRWRSGNRRADVRRETGDVSGLDVRRETRGIFCYTIADLELESTNEKENISQKLYPNRRS